MIIPSHQPIISHLQLTKQEYTDINNAIQTTSKTHCNVVLARKGFFIGVELIPLYKYT